MNTENTVLNARDRRTALWFLWALVPGLFAWRLSASWWSGAGLFVDEAQYWDWSRDLAWGYFSKPPVLPALIRLSTLLAGDGIAGVRSLVVFLWTLTPVVLWRLVWDMFRDQAPHVPVRTRLLVGAWAAALASAMLVFALIGQVATTDGPLLFFWALLMWFFWRAMQTPQRLWPWVLWGILLALALLSKYTACVAVVSALWLAFKQRHASIWQGLALAFMVCGVLLIPHAMWNQTHGWPTLRHTAELLAGSDSAEHAGAVFSALKYTASQWVLVGPVVFLTGVFGFIRWRQKAPKRTDETRPKTGGVPLMEWAWTWTWPIWLLGLMQSLQGKAEMNWPAPAVLGFALMLALWQGMTTLSWRGPWLVLILGAMVGATVSLGGDWCQHLDAKSQGTRWDLWARARGWDAALQSMAPHLAQFPESKIVTSERALIAHAAYAWREQGRRPQAWPTQALPKHHYEMSDPFDPHSAKGKGLPVLLITTQPNPWTAQWLELFPHRQWLHSHTEAGRTLDLWRLDTP